MWRKTEYLFSFPFKKPLPRPQWLHCVSFTNCVQNRLLSLLCYFERASGCITVYLTQLHEVWQKHCLSVGGGEKRDWRFCSCLNIKVGNVFCKLHGTLYQTELTKDITHCSWLQKYTFIVCQAEDICAWFPWHQQFCRSLPISATDMCDFYVMQMNDLLMQQQLCGRLFV